MAKPSHKQQKLEPDPRNEPDFYGINVLFPLPEAGKTVLKVAFWNDVMNSYHTSTRSNSSKDDSANSDAANSQTYCKVFWAQILI